MINTDDPNYIRAVMFPRINRLLAWILAANLLLSLVLAAAAARTWGKDPLVIAISASGRATQMQPLDRPPPVLMTGDAEAILPGHAGHSQEGGRIDERADGQAGREGSGPASAVAVAASSSSVSSVPANENETGASR